MTVVLVTAKTIKAAIRLNRTLDTRKRWSSDLRRVRSSEPGESSLCSSRVKSRATLRRVRSGDSSIEGNTETAIVADDLERARQCRCDSRKLTSKLQVKSEDANRPRDVDDDSALGSAAKIVDCRSFLINHSELTRYGLELRNQHYVLGRLFLGYSLHS